MFLVLISATVREELFQLQIVRDALILMSVQRTDVSANRESAKTRTEPTSVTVRLVTQSRKENLGALMMMNAEVTHTNVIPMPTVQIRQAPTNVPATTDITEMDSPV